MHYATRSAPLPRSKGRPPGALDSRRQLSPAQLARGTDDRGRFIGPRAIERGAAFFWAVPHRRSAAPIHRDDPVFGRGDGLGRGQGGAGQPRALRAGLDFAKLREMAALKKSGTPTTEIAARVGVSRNCAVFHLKGSASMRAALAAVPVSSLVTGHS